MIIELRQMNGKILRIERLKEFCFTQTYGVACDSLWAYFFSQTPVDEIVSIRGYENQKLIFNGFCDCQREREDKNGYEIYFYARSSASVLVDNEAMPLSYNKPSANQLCFNIARGMGFNSSLPNIYSETKYEVTKGTSCYGAISQYVLLISGKSIGVTPNNEIRIIDYSDNVLNLNKYQVVSAVHTINRSEPYLEIAFKKSNAQPDYCVHTKSRLGEKVGINKSMLINLSSLPQWQRENTVLERLKSSYKDYKVLQVTISGYVGEGLLQRFNYKEYNDYALSEKRYFCNKNGEFTAMTLKKRTDIKEITYVD